MNDRSYIYTKNSDPIAFLDAAATANKEQKFKARRVGDDIEIYARTFHTGFRGQAAKLWHFVSGKAHDRRILVHEVMEDVIRQSRIHLGYDMSQTIQDRLLTNVIHKDLSVADIQALRADVQFSIAQLPAGPAANEFPTIGAKLQKATIEFIGNYRQKIAENELEGGAAKKLWKGFKRTISSWGSGAKNCLMENIFGPVGRFFSRKKNVEEGQVPVDVEQQEKENRSKVERLTNNLAEAWYKVLDNDALGPKFNDFRTRLVNSSGSRFQYDLIDSVVTKESFEDTGSMRRIFKNAFAKLREKYVPYNEDNKGMIDLAGQRYNSVGQKTAGNGCSFTYYEHTSSKTEPRIMVKSIEDPMASVDQMRNINARLLNEASYYVSDKNLHQGKVAGLPVLLGTVRMQSGGIGLAFAEPNDGPSARDIVSLMRRMEKVKLLQTSTSAAVRTLILHDLLTGASFLEDHPFASGESPIATFDPTNVAFGSDRIARVSLNGAQPAEPNYRGSAVMEAQLPEGPFGHKIDDLSEEYVSSGPIIEEIFDNGEVSSAEVPEPLLHSPRVSENSYKVSVPAGGTFQATNASPSRLSVMALALATSLFEPEVVAAEPQIGNLMAALDQGGSLHGRKLEEVLKHDAFKRIVPYETKHRKQLAEIIEKFPEHLKEVEKKESKAIDKLKKLKPKADRKAIDAMSSSEKPLQVAKQKKKQGLVKILAHIATEAARGKLLH